jgi:antirestriction protein
MSEYEQEFRDEFGRRVPVISPAAEIEDDEETLEGFARMADDNPDDHDETAGGAFYDNQGSYWDTCEPSEFWERFEEAYEGRYDSDVDFAQEMADSLGADISDEWPGRCIDWTYAARELMYDYFESGGYYFRNI